jgi:hypothetical protein
MLLIGIDLMLLKLAQVLRSALPASLLVSLLPLTAQANVVVTTWNVYVVPQCSLRDDLIAYTLPGIDVTESEVGELGAGTLTLQLAADVTSRPLKIGSVKAYSAYFPDRTDQTALLFGTATPQVDTSMPGTVRVNVTGLSNARSGPVRIHIDGITVVPSSTHNTGGVLLMTSGQNPPLGHGGVNLRDMWMSFGMASDPCMSGLNTIWGGEAKKPRLSVEMPLNLDNEGKSGVTFVGAVTPVGLFLKGQDGSWLPYNAESPAFYAGSHLLLFYEHIDVLDGSIDVSGISGTAIVAGVTTDAGGTMTTKAMFQRIIDEGTYRLISVVK